MIKEQVLKEKIKLYLIPACQVGKRNDYTFTISIEE